MKRNFKPMSMEEAALAQVPGTKLVDKHGCVYTVIAKRPTDLSVLGHVRLVGNGSHPEGQIFGTFTMAMHVEEPVKVPAKPRYLAIANSTPATQDFITYLRTPEAHCLLGLEARNEREDENLRKQYRDLTGEELVEGEGYHVAPISADKHGPEGRVTFNVPAEVPVEIAERMVQKEGLINHLDFLWLLVQEGFRIKRACKACPVLV